MMALPIPLLGDLAGNEAAACELQPGNGTNSPPVTGCENCCELPSPGGAAPGANSPAETKNPIHLLRGSIIESVTDLSLPGTLYPFNLTRSYDSTFAYTGTAGGNNQGEKWRTYTETPYLLLVGGGVDLYLDASSKRSFTGASSPFTAPADYRATMTIENAGTADEVYRLIETDTQKVFDFHGFNSSVAAARRGRLRFITTLQQMEADSSMLPVEFLYDGFTGRLETAYTHQPQDLMYSYSYVSGGAEAGRILQVQLRDFVNGNALLATVEYTYFGEVTTPSADLGTTGDLVQVKVSKLTSDGNFEDRYTQYRYNANHQLTHVFESDAVERLMQAGSYTTPDDILQDDNADTVGSADLEEYASRRFASYASALNTNSVSTIWGSQNLESKYGGSNLNEVPTASTARVQTEIVNSGCGSCGSGSGGMTYTYYYMDLNGGSSADPAVVIRLAIEDAKDSANNNVHRMIWGLNFRGVAIREVLIENATGTSGLKAWCKSKILNSSFQVIEERMPSAHLQVDSDTELAAFLNPTGASGANDTSTMSATAGVVYKYHYDANGNKDWTKLRHDTGSGTVDYFVSATDWGDGSTVPVYLPTKQYSYPTQTTTKASGVQVAYAYTFWNSDLDRPKKLTLTYPNLSSQNGPTSYTEEKYYDNLKRLRWTKDGEGYVNYYSYNPISGELAYTVMDVDPSSTPSGATGNDTKWVSWNDDGDGDFSYDSSGIPTRGPSTGTYVPAVLISSREFDILGRQVLSTDANGRQHAVAHNVNQTIAFPYWNGSTTAMPIQVMESDAGGQPTQSYEVRAGYSSISSNGTLPTGFSSPPSTSTDYTALTKYTRNGVSGQLQYVDRYHDVTGSTLSTHYDRTAFYYDPQGRQAATAQTVSGTSASSVTAQLSFQGFDVQDRVTSTKRWRATSFNLASTYSSVSTTAAGKSTLSTVTYDAGGAGDGHVTKARQYHTASIYTDVTYQRNYRGQARGVLREYTDGSTNPVSPYSVMDIDWMGRTVASAVYTSQPTWATVLGDVDYVATTSSGGRNNLTKNNYDDLGRVYRTEQFPGTEGTNHFEINNYYDRRGNLVATGDKHSAHQEFAYDGAGRQYQQRTVTQTSGTYSSGAYTYAAPIPNPTFATMSSGNGGIIELSHSEYETGTNRVSMSHVVELNHDDSNGFSLASGAPTGGVRQTTWNWYDAADRPLATAYHGSGDTTTNVWKSTALPSGYVAGTPLDWTDAGVYNGEVLLTKYAYNADSGLQESVVSGVKKNGSNTDTTTSKTFYDDLGRRTFVAENWANFAPPSTGIGGGTNNDQDRVIGWTYNGLDRTVNLTAYNAGTTSQVTKYLYEDPTNASLVTNTIYPDSSDTTSSGTDQVTLAYHLDGSVNTRTDQRGVVMTYTYDSARRLSREGATTIPVGVDDFVKSISRTYDTLGRVTHVTSWQNNNGSGTVRNELKYTYNADGILNKSEQDHSGAVGGTEPSVQYAYDSSQSGSIFTNGLRPTRVTYPTTARKIHTTYGTANAINDRLSRTATLADDNGSGSPGTELVAYQYNGTSRQVNADYTGPDVDSRLYNLSGAGTNIYNGWDRFGRRARMEWWNYGSSAMRDQFSYTYDYVGNRLTRTDSIYAVHSHTFTYDGLQRLRSNDQSTASKDRYWELDQLGNWQKLRNGTTSGGTLLEERTHNTANEFTNYVTPGTNIDPTYDAAGNMATMPQPKAPTVGYTAKYDAWNRLVELKQVSTVKAAYQYDGLHRRIVRDETGSSGVVRHFYYNENWQCLEERATEGGNPIKQYVYHPHYIDALAVSYTDLNADGDRLDTDEGTHYYSHDANFNVTSVLNTAGSPVERYEYAPYSFVRVLESNYTADADDRSDMGNEFLYTGRRLDPETGLQYSRYRYYHPQMGRFINRDPIGYLDGLNWYSYTRGNPLIRVDAYGLSCSCTVAQPDPPNVPPPGKPANRWWAPECRPEISNEKQKTMATGSCLYRPGKWGFGWDMPANIMDSCTSGGGVTYCSALQCVRTVTWRCNTMYANTIGSYWEVWRDESTPCKPTDIAWRVPF